MVFHLLPVVARKTQRVKSKARGNALSTRSPSFRRAHVSPSGIKAHHSPLTAPTTHTNTEMVAGALLRRSSGGSSAASFAKSWAQQWMMRRGASSAHHDGTLLFARPACSSSYSTSSQPPPPPLYTSTHEVLRPESVAPDGAVTMTVGLTERAFDMIGDVKRIETMVDTGAAVGAGEQLMKLHWEGFKRTASDELYHALWANVSDHRGLALPFAASVVGVNGMARIGVALFTTTSFFAVETRFN
jgi:hypothetical protein